MSTTRPPYDVSTISVDAFPGLTSMQRSRLVRSTNKVAKLLGETPVPHLTLSTESPPRNKSRDIIQECPRSPIVSLTKKLARIAFEPIQAALRRDPHTNFGPASAGASSRWRDRSPVLVFDAPNLASVDSRAYLISHVSSSSPSPVSPSPRRRRSSLTSSSSSESIVYPTEWEKYEEERTARSRRKRLTKLSRYLGESIPSDLILPNVITEPTDTPVFTPAAVVPGPSTVHSVASLSEQGTNFSLPSPIPKSPKPAVLRTGDSFVGSIGRSLSYRSNADVASPRLLARKLRRSHSESALSPSQERISTSALLRASQ